MDETTDKEKAGNLPACPDLYTLIFRLTIYIAKTLSNLTVCFERKTDFPYFVESTPCTIKAK
ncbi:hypothetical protein, partial [Escherichia coli]|uniref:hypothetical protein n=2 Tax=Escherichia coli TaxID=562 RepID=UPI003896B973